MLTKKETPKKESVKSEVKSSKIIKNAAETPATTKANTSTPPPKPQMNQAENTYSPQSTKQPYDSPADRKGNPKTRVTIKYNVGFSNQLFIRGKGANLNWEKGQLLLNTKPDEWVWETDANFNQCEFKVLINDQGYENGENHLLKAGATLLYTPYFP